MNSSISAALSLPSKNDQEPIASINFDAVPLFACLPETARERILKNLKARHFEAGSAIIDRGETGDDVFILHSGTVQVINYSDSGRMVSYATLEPDSVFGELAVIDGKPRSATVIAKSDCSVGVLNGAEFMHLVTRHEAFMLLVLQQLAGIIRCADDRIEDLSLLGAEQRVCLELMNLLEPDPGNLAQMRVYPAPTQVSIAATIGVTRQTVARAFIKLFKEGTIERRGRALFVMDCDRLEKNAFRV